MLLQIKQNMYLLKMISMNWSEKLTISTKGLTKDLINIVFLMEQNMSIQEYCKII